MTTDMARRLSGSCVASRFGETMRRVVHATDDANEGMAAAAERRAPHWQVK
jgi:E-phenylitaconyl-CoA hydratase